MNENGREVSECRDLSALFAHTSIAIVGANNNPGKYGNWLSVRALRGTREVHLINRTTATVLGPRTAPSLSAVGSKIDLAINAFPAAAFEDGVEDAISARVSAIVAITAGLGEAGAYGLSRQRSMVAACARPGSRWSVRTVWACWTRRPDWTTAWKVSAWVSRSSRPTCLHGIVGQLSPTANTANPIDVAGGASRTSAAFRMLSRCCRRSTRPTRSS